MATYIKLKSGDWGVKGTGLREGQSVTVTKKDGGTKTETIKKVVFRAADGTCIAAIAKKEGGWSAARAILARDRNCRICHGPLVNASYARATDDCCGSCAFDEYDF